MENRSSIISRRNFMKQAGISGASLTLAAFVPVGGKDLFELINPATESSLGTELISWISIGKTGLVTIMCHRSEMGQGTFQAIPQIIAEELEVDLGQVNILFAQANPKKYGPQPQEGSFSIRGWCQQLLHSGAAAREMLIRAAAEQWKVSELECVAESGAVIHRSSGRKLAYGQLVETASRLTPPKQVTLKLRKDYKLIGKPMPRQDIPLKTNGAAIFGLDKKLPGMKYAVVERNPRFRGKVKSFDDTETRKIAGVTHVFKVQRAVFNDLYDGVAIVASSTWAAMQGRNVLKVDWDDAGFDFPDSQSLAQQMQENLLKTPRSADFEPAFETASKKIEATYETPYQSHSCMEPLNCTADVRDNSIEIWGPIQEANWIQADLSQRMNIPIEHVRVNMTFLGGGFGRKAFTDYPHEAALISKEIKAPVQVVWTREDDMRAGPFRTGASYLCRGGIDDAGHIHAFQCITAAQWIGQAWSPSPYPPPPAPEYNKGNMEGLLEPYYHTIPHYSFAGVGTRTPVPVMWWRSVYASTNAFAAESFVDELANAAGTDPLEFRKKHLKNPRYQALMDQLATASGWAHRKEKDGWGIAATECFGSICGHVVKVGRKADGSLKIEKVTAVMDCGWYVNPDTIRAQVEGSIVMALGAAIMHETTFKDGKAVQQNFDTYPMPRIVDTPIIEVHIAENNEKAGGVGEPGLPPFAPALCNAIFDLTGKRIRKLPFRLEDIS
jgi:isoquinoline 1-oxidoreductase beta subunit